MTFFNSLLLPIIQANITRCKRLFYKFSCKISKYNYLPKQKLLKQKYVD